MRLYTQCLALLISGSLAVPALAASPAWRYAEGGYTTLDPDGNGNVEPDGVFIGGKYMLQDNIYLNGEFSLMGDGGYDFNTLTAGAGYRLPINGNTDAYFGANLERIDSDGYDDTGYSLNAGLRSMLTPELEVNGELGYYDVNDGDTTLKFGANYYFTPQWALGASFEFRDNADITQLSARYVF